jgi:hypothetical protein
MKKPTKQSSHAPSGETVRRVVGQAEHAEQNAQKAKQRVRCAKAELKRARKAFKEAKKLAKEARKQAKQARKALEVKSSSAQSPKPPKPPLRTRPAKPVLRPHSVKRRPGPKPAVDAPVAVLNPPASGAPGRLGADADAPSR